MDKKLLDRCLLYLSYEIPTQRFSAPQHLPEIELMPTQSLLRAAAEAAKKAATEADSSGMLSSSDVSSSLVTFESKPLPILRFPAEIRNKVYSHLISPQARGKWLKRVPANQGTWSRLGLANSNKQLRAKFRPLIFNNNTFIVELNNYPLFRHGNAGNPPLRLGIFAGRDVEVPDVMDFHTLFLAKSLDRDLDLSLHLGCKIFQTDAFGMWYLCKRDHELRRLFRDIKSGFISRLALVKRQTGSGADWEIATSIEAGGLNPGEIIWIGEHCRYLLSACSPLPVSCAVKVTDLSGKCVEEWFANDKAQVLRKKA